MANGVMHATPGRRRSVVAIDPAIGELLWVHGENEGARGSNAPRLLSGRGLAYWTDGREERILYVTQDIDSSRSMRTPAIPWRASASTTPSI
jgi:quinoprotein glucose dehydrogenase